MHNNGTLMETWPRASIAADLIPTAGTNLFFTETFTTGFNQQSAYDIKKIMFIGQHLPKGSKPKNMLSLEFFLNSGSS